jgi:hypothetical protein
MCTDCHSPVMKPNRDKIFLDGEDFLSVYQKSAAIIPAGSCSCDCAQCDNGSHCFKKDNGCNR